MRLNSEAMKTKHLFLYGLLLLGFPAGVLAQNIVNDTIVVSTAGTVEIVFPSQPDEAKVIDGDGSYDVARGTKKSLIVTASKKVDSRQNLSVKEGGRTHRFALIYAEALPKMQYDYGSTKKLRENANRKKAILAAGRSIADDFFAKGEYDKALEKYTWLTDNVDDAEGEPFRARIAECLQQTELARQTKFQDALGQAKAFETAGKFKEADAAYANALQLYPADAGVQVRRQKNRDNRYTTALKRADSADKAKDPVALRLFLDEARQADPAKFSSSKYNGQYGKVVADANSKAYKLQKKTGDEAFALHDWAAATLAYEAALGINGINKVEEKACRDQLMKIQEAVAAEARYKAKEAEYYAALSEAKTLTGKKDLDGAIARYNAALALFPDRQFAKDKKNALTKLKNSASAKR